MNNYFTLALIVIILLLNIACVKGEKVLSSNDKAKNDQHYLIYFNNEYDEFQLYSNPKNRKRQESTDNVLSFADEIHNLIVENKDTYKNPTVLDEIEETSKLRKRSGEDSSELYNFGSSNFIYLISSVGHRVVYYAYLSQALYEKIKAYPSVIDCVPDKANVSINHYYNEQEILDETEWEELSVRENSYLHLSLISQGHYYKDVIGQYDNNYYYPSSAGKDVDIIIMDSSFNFTYFEFENTDDRTVECTASFVDGKPVLGDCGHSEIYHGEQVADTVGGIKHGVANRANIYGVAIPCTDEGDIKESDILAALQFILENMIRRKHKTIINVSSGSWAKEEHQFFDQYRDIVKKITEKGGLVVCSAGNNGNKILPGLNGDYYIPCSYNTTICVGATSSYRWGGQVQSYDRAHYSNFGSFVDIFAPGTVIVEYIGPLIEKICIDNPYCDLEGQFPSFRYYNIRNETIEMGIRNDDLDGTSYSSPIAAGVIATYMSEHPEIDFDKRTVLTWLYDQSIPIQYRNNEFKFEDGIMINNGKHIVYSEDGHYNGCGIFAGNLPCEEPEVVPTN